MAKPVKRSLIAAAIVVVVVFASVATTWAQRYGSSQSYSGNVRYDGRFAFIRMSYPFGGRMTAPWSHDYPDGEHNFMKLFTSISNISGHIDETSIMSFSDPELFKFPVAYLCEPGYWNMPESDVVGLRAYLQKGGFLIVDDFPQVSRGYGDSWGNFEVQMARVFPDAKWTEFSDASHPIFHSFFEVDSLSIVPMAYNLGDHPRFRALFEDNDPNKRIMVIANYMQDLSEFWEWSATGRYLVSDDNQAYKVGINQFIYGITH